MRQWYPDLPPGGSVKGLSTPFLYQFGSMSMGSGSGGKIGGNNPLLTRSLVRGGTGGFNPEDDVFGPDPVVAPTHKNNAKTFTELLKEANVPEMRIPASPRLCPKSDIGTLAKLPGELRNKIYRMVLVEPKLKVTITLKPFTCRSGPCVHRKATTSLPGILSTCQQIRWESAPIYFGENEVFRFDESVVQQNCVGQFIRCIGDMVHLISQFHFELLRPLWREDEEFYGWKSYQFIVDPPRYSKTGLFDFAQFVDGIYVRTGGKHHVCDCHIHSLFHRINREYVKMIPYDPFVERPDHTGISLEDPVGQFLIAFAEDDQFHEYIWCMRKSSPDFNIPHRCYVCRRLSYEN